MPDVATIHVLISLGGLFLAFVAQTGAIFFTAGRVLQRLTSLERDMEEAKKVRDTQNAKLREAEVQQARASERADAIDRRLDRMEHVIESGFTRLEEKLDGLFIGRNTPPSA